MAWELLTEVYGIDPKELYATVFEGSAEDGTAMDEEAKQAWLKHLPEDHIILGNKHDNFWEMGDTGPCGPSSEIHIDIRSAEERASGVPGRDLVNMSDPHVIEIWNLVFMEFQRLSDGHLEPLPAKNIDTGMGFERLCAVLQGKNSNYDTDVFSGMLARIGELSGHKYGENHDTDVAMRVIADHIRAISFSIADGQLPSNVKAGYVIRRILRRAVRYGYTFLELSEPFLCRLVPQLVDDMGEAYPEIKAQQKLIENVIREEEMAFLRTLDRGIKLLNEYIATSKDRVLDGVNAFTLYDTYGFPIDLTQLIAAENGFTVDMDGFQEELRKQKERARNATANTFGDWVEYHGGEEVEFVGFDTTEVDGALLLKQRTVVQKNKEMLQLVFDRTPFYGEMGGEIGDTGFLEGEDGERIRILNTVKENNLTIHLAERLPQPDGAMWNELEGDPAYEPNVKFFAEPKPVGNEKLMNTAPDRCESAIFNDEKGFTVVARLRWNLPHGAGDVIGVDLEFNGVRSPGGPRAYSLNTAAPRTFPRYLSPLSLDYAKLG